MARRELTAISLYTGAGGLDLGFEAAGFNTRVAVEMDADAAATLRRNRRWELIESDIHAEAARTSEILTRSQLREGDADVLIGGPPCQPFSKSSFWVRGEALRLSDPRAATLDAYLRVLREAKPKAFLLENVPGIAYSAQDEGLAFLADQIKRLNRATGCNYSFASQQLRAVEFGVPQDRARVFVIGHREGRKFRFPSPTHHAVSRDRRESQGLLLSEDLKEPLTAWDAIGDLQDDDDARLKISGRWAELLPSIPEGSNYLHHTDRGGGLPLFGWRRRYWSFLLKLSKRMPSWTIAAQPGPAIGPFHWKNRRLSMRELSRLQTIPDNYVIVGNLRAVQKQVGNAVPSALAEVLAREIRRQLLDAPPDGGKELTLLPLRRFPVPRAEPTRAVPEKYLSLVGDHEPHPGTGKGYGAVRRHSTSGD